nr:hypothetical protein HK105_001060 [Polyrhizophydium stewartii]
MYQVASGKLSPFNINDPYTRYAVMDFFDGTDATCAGRIVRRQMVRIYDTCTAVAATNDSRTLYALSQILETSVIQSLCTDSACKQCTTSAGLPPWLLGSANSCRKQDQDNVRGFYFINTNSTTAGNNNNNGGNGPTSDGQTGTNGQLDGSGGSGPSGLVIGLSVVGVLVIFGLLGGGGFIMYRRHSRARETESTMLPPAEGLSKSKRETARAVSLALEPRRPPAAVTTGSPTTPTSSTALPGPPSPRGSSIEGSKKMASLGRNSFHFGTLGFGSFKFTADSDAPAMPTLKSTASGGAAGSVVSADGMIVLTTVEQERFRKMDAANTNGDTLVPRIALIDYEPRRLDELKVTIGDRIVIESLWGDGWCQAYNLTTGERGTMAVAAVGLDATS